MSLSKRQWVVASLVCLCTVQLAIAQARSSISISRPGEGIRLGDTAASRTFLRNSTGVGALGSRSRGAGTNVLRSSLTSNPGSRLRRRSSGRRYSSSLDSLSEIQTSRGQTYASSMARLQPRRSKGRFVPLTEAAKDPLFGTQAYLEAVGMDQEQLLDSNAPITSLVPDAPGEYTEHLNQGDRLFREGSYIEALASFEMANAYQGTDPESLLYLMHTKVALGQYHSAAFLLRKALDNFPELPLVNLRPKGFYEDPSAYVRHVEKLQRRAEEDAYDPDPQLLLTYYQWFAGDHDKAQRSLKAAVEAAKKNARAMNSQATLKATDTFQRGIKSIRDESQQDSDSKPENRSDSPEETDEKTGGETTAGTGSQPSPDSDESDLNEQSPDPSR
jgi:tetratricopeptide (TPR) repeat protein